jgi:hypothetical protein
MSVNAGGGDWSQELGSGGWTSLRERGARNRGLLTHIGVIGSISVAGFDVDPTGDVVFEAA